MFRLLFISSDNSERSLIAGAYAQSIISQQEVDITCSGINNEQVHPMTITVMKEICLQTPKISSLHSAQTTPFDIVVLLCDEGNDNCPELPGSPALIHWTISNPIKNYQDSGDLIAAFHKTRDEILHKVSHFIEDGYFEALTNQRLVLGSLIENMVDGVLAHDSNRRIFYFNRVAQRITGYTYSEVIGRDCHEVFPGRFCGGNCNYCDDGHISNRTRYHTTFLRKDGRLIDLEMSSVTITTSVKIPFTTLLLFHDYKGEHLSGLQIAKSYGFQGIIGNHPVMEMVFDTIREVSNINVPVLIEGESGTGKEMVANAIHNLSTRAIQPFVPVNCGALPEGTLESELFGHVKGAFTGAIRHKKGRFELAEGGTIFLDEISEIPLSTQLKLLRVLQEKSFIPVGGEKLVKVDARVICATNQKLKECVKKGLFREDLYYRLAVVPITLAPLRDRASDIPQLLDHFLLKLSANSGRNVRQISDKALQHLKEYRWPGNVRELINALQYALIKCHDDILDVHHLPHEILADCNNQTGNRAGRHQKLNSEDVAQAIEQTAGNKSAAAKILGVSRPTLYGYLKNNKL